MVLCELVERMQGTSLVFLKGGSGRVRILRFRRPEFNCRRRHYSLMPEQKLSPSGNQMSAHGNQTNYSVRKFKSDVLQFDFSSLLFNSFYRTKNTIAFSDVSYDQASDRRREPPVWGLFCQNFGKQIVENLQNFED